MDTSTSLIKNKKVKEEAQEKSNKYKEEFIFETSEQIELFQTFDDMGLREDLIKGKQFYLYKSKVYTLTVLTNLLQSNKELLFL